MGMRVTVRPFNQTGKGEFNHQTLKRKMLQEAIALERKLAIFAQRG